MTPSPTQDTVITALRTFLLAVLPVGTDVILAQVNRVPEPTDPNFVLMTPIRQIRLSTNVRSDEIPPISSTSSITQSVEHVIQMDVHGPASGDNAVVIATLLRDQYGVDQFAAVDENVIPLYSEDPRQLPFINAESQYEDRWVIEAYIQANQTITITQQFADVVDVTLLEVDATYPPS